MASNQKTDSGSSFEKKNKDQYKNMAVFRFLWPALYIMKLLTL